MKIDRFKVMAVVIGGLLGCSSASQQRQDADKDASQAAADAAADHAGDGSAPVMPYTCGPDFAVVVDGGQAPDPDAGAPLTCVLGQSYCSIELPHPDFAGKGTPTCRDFSPTDPCRDTPTCACMKAQYEHFVNCRCADIRGFATITCEGV